MLASETLGKLALRHRLRLANEHADLSEMRAAGVGSVFVHGDCGWWPRAVDVLRGTSRPGGVLVSGPVGSEGH